jgi:hypothetical protein
MSVGRDVAKMLTAVGRLWCETANPNTSSVPSSIDNTVEELLNAAKRDHSLNCREGKTEHYSETASIRVISNCRFDYHDVYLHVYAANLPYARSGVNAD